MASITYPLGVKNEEIRDAVLSEDENRKLTEFKRTTGCTDSTFSLLFLYARKFDLDRSITLYQNHQYKLELHGLSGLCFLEILPELKSRKIIIPGSQDREGHGMLIYYANRHDPEAFPPVATLALFYYMTLRLLEDGATARNGIVLFCNLSGMKWKNWDPDFVQLLLDFNGLPTRVKKIFLYDPPWWLGGLVSLFYPFITDKLRARLTLCYDYEPWISASSIPKDIRKGTLLYDHDVFVRGSLKKAQEAGEPIHRVLDEDESLGVSSSARWNSRSNPFLALESEDTHMRKAVLVIRETDPFKLTSDFEATFQMNDADVIPIPTVDARLATLNRQLKTRLTQKIINQMSPPMRQRAWGPCLAALNQASHQEEILEEESHDRLAIGSMAL